MQRGLWGGEEGTGHDDTSLSVLLCISLFYVLNTAGESGPGLLTCGSNCVLCCFHR